MEYSRKAVMYRPACLINQTGVRSTSSPRAARTRMSRSPGLDDLAAEADVVVSPATADMCKADGYAASFCDTPREAGDAEKAFDEAAERANARKLQASFIVFCFGQGRLHEM